jgi:hypothetical protein
VLGEVGNLGFKLGDASLSFDLFFFLTRHSVSPWQIEVYPYLRWHFGGIRRGDKDYIWLVKLPAELLKNQKLDGENPDSKLYADILTNQSWLRCSEPRPSSGEKSVGQAVAIAARHQVNSYLSSWHSLIKPTYRT